MQGGKTIEGYCKKCEKPSPILEYWHDGQPATFYDFFIYVARLLCKNCGPRQITEAELIELLKHTKENK